MIVDKILSYEIKINLPINLCGIYKFLKLMLNLIEYQID